MTDRAVPPLFGGEKRFFHENAKFLLTNRTDNAIILRISYIVNALMENITQRTPFQRAAVAVRAVRKIV